MTRRSLFALLGITPWLRAESQPPSFEFRLRKQAARMTQFYAVFPDDQARTLQEFRDADNKLITAILRDGWSKWDIQDHGGRLVATNWLYGKQLVEPS